MFLIAMVIHGRDFDRSKWLVQLLAVRALWGNLLRISGNPAYSSMFPASH